MKNIVILLSILVILIGTLSAQLTITPSSINLGNVYPAQTYQIQLNITGLDAVSVLHFTSTNQFTITPNETIIHNGDSITINITISSDIQTGVLNFDLSPYIEVEQVEVLSPQIIYQGGGGSYGDRTRVIYKNNTIYKENECQLCEIKNETGNITISPNIQRNEFIGILTATGIFALIIGLSFCIYKLSKRKPKKIEDRLVKTQKELDDIQKEIEEKIKKDEEAQN